MFSEYSVDSIRTDERGSQPTQTVIDALNLAYIACACTASSNQLGFDEYE